MDKCFPNLMINNAECLRDLTHIFNVNTIVRNRDIKVGLWQENPDYSFTHLSLWTEDFQVVFKGDGIVDIIPNKELYGDRKFDLSDTFYDTHSYYGFEKALQMLFGDDVAKKYRIYLCDDQKWHHYKK